jgi:hypothetical protein
MLQSVVAGHGPRRGSVPEKTSECGADRMQQKGLMPNTLSAVSDSVRMQPKMLSKRLYIAKQIKSDIGKIDPIAALLATSQDEQLRRRGR